MRLKHVVWNFAGLGTPLLMAVISIPPLLHNIGAERFGLLTLAWGLITYSGIFDLGIGRATTQYIAQLRGKSASFEILAVFKTAIQTTLFSGVAGSFLLLLAISLDVQNYIPHSVEVGNELKIATIILSFIVPIQALATTCRGVNEAFENFRGISLLRMAVGTFNFLGPYWISQYTKNLPLIILVLLASRLIALAIFYKIAKECILNTIGNSLLFIDTYSVRKKLILAGGWFSIASIASQLIGQVDRFMIAYFISATAVSIYTLPYDMVIHSLFVIGAITTILFPKLTHGLETDKQATIKYFHKILKFSISGMVFISVLLFYLMPFIFDFWIGKKNNTESVTIGKILSIGLPFFTISSIYTSLLHAYGEVKVTAKIGLIEFFIFSIIIALSIITYGCIGAAIAWVARVMIDAFIFFTISKKITSHTS